MTEQAQMYQYIFYIGMGLGGAAFILTLVLFFKLHIPKVIGDLTGTTARKATYQIRKESEDTEQRHKSEQITKRHNLEHSYPEAETVPLDQLETINSDSSPTVDLMEQKSSISGMEVKEDITIVGSDVVI